MAECMVLYGTLAEKGIYRQVKLEGKGGKKIEKSQYMTKL